MTNLDKQQVEKRYFCIITSTAPPQSCSLSLSDTYTKHTTYTHTHAHTHKLPPVRCNVKKLSGSSILELALGSSLSSATYELWTWIQLLYPSEPYLPLFNPGIRMGPASHFMMRIKHNNGYQLCMYFSRRECPL